MRLELDAGVSRFAPTAAASGRGAGARALAGALAVAAAAVALGLTSLLEGPLHGPFFFPSLGATVLVALYLGPRASAITLALATLGHAVLFLTPRGSLAVAYPHDALRLAGWALTALVVSSMVGRVRAAATSERDATRRLAQLVVSERRARELYQRLQSATVACSAAGTFGEVAFALVESALSHMGPSTVNLATVDERGDLRITFSQGVPDEELRRFPSIAADAQLPAAECARTRRLVSAVGGAEIDRRYPELAAFRAAVGFESLASIPIETAGELHGVLGLAFPDARVLDEDDRQFLVALSDQAGLAIARARSYDAERRAREEAERIARVKEQLLAVVGHDLRNPLSAIVNGMNVVFRRGELTARDAATLRRVASSAERMNGVIRDLLDFSRVRQGLGIPVQLLAVDLEETAREVIAEFEDRPDPPAIELQARGDLRLLADRQRIAQAVSNLVGNAVQHGAGSPVRVDLAARADAVAISVHNGGRPIPPEVLPHVFEPFRRGGGDGGGPDGGSVGLGLFIVDAIAKAHGGRVTVESSEAGGTRFTLTLPRTPAATTGPGAGA